MEQEALMCLRSVPVRRYKGFAMTKEEQILRNRFLDLANTTYRRGIPTATDFLSLYEQDFYYQVKKELPPVYSMLSGGNSISERKMVLFLPEQDYAGDYLPIAVLKLVPVNERFSDELSHRDYLGALMNLGIERSVLGDIMIDDKAAYLYCKENIADYIIENLYMVRHTSMSVTRVSESVEIVPKFEEIKGSVASPRLDSVLALAFHSSRSKLSGLIEGKKVFVNSRLVESNSYQMKNGDVVSVRGYGKFIYKETVGTTKKGRSYISLNKYT